MEQILQNRLSKLGTTINQTAKQRGLQWAIKANRLYWKIYGRIKDMEA